MVLLLELNGKTFGPHSSQALQPIDSLKRKKFIVI